MFLVLILVGAATISWWSAREEAKVVHHIQEEVHKLFPRFVSDPTSIERFLIDPVLEPVVVKSLQTVATTSSQKNKEIVVIVTDGDSVIYGDGSATHVVLLEVDKQPIAGLRVVCDSESDPLAIAGVFPGSFLKVDTQ
jgi:hypothetical protein